VPSAPADETAPPSAKPTTAQLASLAAALSREKEQPEWLVKYGLAIWESAHELLTKPQPQLVEPGGPSEPEPKRYPVTLDEFLRLMLPRLIGRTGEMYGVFREYLDFRLRNPSPPDQYWDDKPLSRIPPNRIPFDCCHPRIVPATEPFPSLTSDGKPGKPPVPTTDDVDKRFALWQSNPIPDCNSFHYHAGWFRNWYQTMHAATIREKRRAAGAKGLASEKRNKSKSEADRRKPDKRKGARPPRDHLRQAIESAVGGLDTILPPKKP